MRWVFFWAAWLGCRSGVMANPLEIPDGLPMGLRELAPDHTWHNGFSAAIGPVNGFSDAVEEFTAEAYSEAILLFPKSGFAPGVEIDVQTGVEEVAMESISGQILRLESAGATVARKKASQVPTLLGLFSALIFCWILGLDRPLGILGLDRLPGFPRWNRRRARGRWHYIRRRAEVPDRKMAF